MLQLYLAAFGAVVAANVIVVIAIAATIRRDLSRSWRLWPRGHSIDRGLPTRGDRKVIDHHK